jgi:hypothetical protein
MLVGSGWWGRCRMYVVRSGLEVRDWGSILVAFSGLEQCGCSWRGSADRGASAAAAAAVPDKKAEIYCCCMRSYEQWPIMEEARHKLSTNTCTCKIRSTVEAWYFMQLLPKSMGAATQSSSGNRLR